MKRSTIVVGSALGVVLITIVVFVILIAVGL
jgi:hypothetical protein